MLKAKTTNLQYDEIGRLNERTEEDGTTTWVYDIATNGIGLVASVGTSDGYTQSFTYDNLSRVLSETEVIEGTSYTTSYAYDNLGRIETITYPSGFGIKHIYNQYFFLAEIHDLSDDGLIWQANAYNAKGQLLQQTLGNGQVTNFTYDDLRDYLERIHTASGANLIQDLSFTFNDIGHLTQRKDDRQNLTENFLYDDLNRLTSAEVVGAQTITTSYDILGNITFKSDVGTYSYGENGAGPHAVTSIVPVNNNVCIPSATTDITYTSFDKVKTLRQSINRLEIKYGAGHQRIVQREYRGDMLERTKIHVGNLYEKEIKGALTREKHYIRGDGGVVAVYEKRSDNQNTFKYWHKDHLGSLHAVTSQSGFLDEELSYDAWGKRRNTDWTPTDDTPSVFYDRGFTGHEHIDLFGLVNMNGRVYDPVLGRFISPDPAIQDITDLQNLNRYTYVLNNPLSYTDPSGFFFKKIFRAIKKVVKKVFSFVKKNIVAIASIAIGVATGGALLFVTGLQFGTFLGGLVSAAGFSFGSTVAGSILSGGSLGTALRNGIKAAAITSFTAVASFGVGQFASQFSGISQFGVKAAAQGVVGGVKEIIRGGKFEHGFIEGTFESLTNTNNIKELTSNPIKQIFVKSVLSGTKDAIGGGKFANGAISAAFDSLTDKVSDNAFRNKAIDWFKKRNNSISTWIGNRLQKYNDLYNDIKNAGGTLNKARIGLDFISNNPLSGILAIGGGGLYLYTNEVDFDVGGISNNFKLFDFDIGAKLGASIALNLNKKRSVTLKIKTEFDTNLGQKDIDERGEELPIKINF